MASVRQRGSTWQAIVRKKKAGKIVFEESRTFATERLAQSWARRLEAAIEKDGIPERQVSTMTLGELLTLHKQKLAELTNMRRQMGWELDQMAEEFANVKLSELTPALFTKFAVRRKNEGTGGATVLHNLSTIMGALSSAKAVLDIPVNGAVVREAIDTLGRMNVVHRSLYRDRRPTEDELARLYKEFRRIAQHPSTQIPMAEIIALAIELPRRREDLLTMRWDDYNGREIKLFDTKSPDGYRDELIPVPAGAAAIIDALPRIDERILPYVPESVSAAFQRACIRLGIEDLHFHDLRHEGISRLFAHGLDIPEVSLISGHRSWSTLKRYTHLKPHDVLEKLNASRQKTQEAAA